MKKSFIFAAAFTICAATASFAQQGTQSSTPAKPNANAGGQGQNAGTAAQSKQGSTAENTNKNGGQSASPGAANADPSGNAGAAATGATGPGGQQAQKTSENDESNRPGGEEHKNANDVGKYSGDNDSKSMLNSKEARDRRRKNMTESDTTLKSGSGSSPRNTRNHTGKTGNYRNQQIKVDQKVPTRE